MRKIYDLFPWLLFSYVFNGKSARVCEIENLSSSTRQARDTGSLGIGMKATAGRGDRCPCDRRLHLSPRVILEYVPRFRLLNYTGMCECACVQLAVPKRMRCRVGGWWSYRRTNFSKCRVYSLVIKMACHTKMEMIRGQLWGVTARVQAEIMEWTYRQ